MFQGRMFRGEGFSHGYHRESPFQKGDLKYVILDLLKEKPRYGYDIIRSLEKKSHGFYSPSPGVVYPTLQMLEEMGYATAQERDGKKVYTITDAGLHFLSERHDTADEVRRHMKHHWHFDTASAIGDLMGEMAQFRRSIGPRIRKANPDKLKKIREVVARARAEIEKILDEN